MLRICFVQHNGVSPDAKFMDKHREQCLGLAEYKAPIFRYSINAYIFYSLWYIVYIHILFSGLHCSGNNLLP